MPYQGMGFKDCSPEPPILKGPPNLLFIEQSKHKAQIYVLPLRKKCQMLSLENIRLI
jgi:hypothetical protein